MLLVKTKVGPSAIEGTGLFADEFIPKGTPYWEFVPGFDLVMTKEEIFALPEPAQKYWELHAYASRYTGRLILCGDDTRFMNHSRNPNIIDSDERKNGEEVNVAARDIQKGEELTVDYTKFAEPIKPEDRPWLLG